LISQGFTIVLLLYSWGPVRILDEDHLTTTVEDAEEDTQHSGNIQDNKEPVVLSARESDRVSSVKETTTNDVKETSIQDHNDAQVHDDIIETPVATFDNVCTFSV